LQKWGLTPTTLAHSDFEAAWSQLGEIAKDLETKAGCLHVLVDYSSMSRAWYAAILNYFRFVYSRGDVIIDFVYTPGKYSASYEDELRTSVISKIVSLPGLEGLSGTRESSIAAFGLGFSPAAALGVLERLQPQLIFSFLASPAVKDHYSRTCKEVNKRLVESSSFSLLLPLFSVSTSYRRLCEAIIPFLPNQQVTFIPMGPKPHVLASMLVAAKFRQAGCMYAQLSRRDVSDIEEESDPFGVRVVLSQSK